MDFIIVGQKEADNYVIQDLREGMGGKCCCTRYTLLQLIQKGYKICGVRVVNGKITSKDVIVCNMDGTPATRNNTFPSVDDTKRSATTIEKGIKLSREEKKTLREASEKRLKTMKANKKEAERIKLEQEKAEKERIAKQKKEEALIKKLGKRVQTTKPFFKLRKIHVWASEYDWKEEYNYTVELNSPASITSFCKGIMDGRYQSKSFNIECSARSLNDRLRKRGTVEVDVISRFPLEDRDFIVVAADTVIYDFEQHYESYEFTAEFSGKKKLLTSLSTHHISEEDLKRGRRFGSTACCEENLDVIRNYFFYLGYKTY